MEIGNSPLGGVRGGVINITKKIAALAAAGAILLSAASAFAGKPPKGEKGLKGQAGKSNNAFVELWQKDQVTWEIIENGAWGKLKYNLVGETFDFLFNGHGLTAGEDYTLIYYPDPWPGNGLICLGSGTANIFNDIHIKDSVDTGDMPNTSDNNYYWNLVGDWVIDFDFGSIWSHDMTVASQTGSSFTGAGGYPSGGGPYSHPWTMTGNVTGTDVSLTIVYVSPAPNPGYTVDLTGTIANDGSMSGDCTTSIGQSCTWSTSSGLAASPGGAKIWLVLSDDIVCGDRMYGWNPTEYLFEYDVITFDDTDG